MVIERVLTGNGEPDLFFKRLPDAVVRCAEVDALVGLVESDDLKRLVELDPVSGLLAIDLETKAYELLSHDCPVPIYQNALFTPTDRWVRIPPHSTLQHN